MVQTKKFFLFRVSSEVKSLKIDISASLPGVLQNFKETNFKVNVVDWCFCFVTAPWDTSWQLHEMSKLFKLWYIFNYLILFIGNSLNGNFNLKTLDLSANNIASLKVCVWILIIFKGNMKFYYHYLHVVFWSTICIFDC